MLQQVSNCLRQCLGFVLFEQPYGVSALTEIKMLKYNRIEKRDDSGAWAGASIRLKHLELKLQPGFSGAL